MLMFLYGFSGWQAGAKPVRSSLRALLWCGTHQFVTRLNATSYLISHIVQPHE